MPAVMRYFKMREPMAVRSRPSSLAYFSIHAYRAKEVKYELSISDESPQMPASGEFVQTLLNEKAGETFSIIQPLYAAESIWPLQPAVPVC